MLELRAAVTPQYTSMQGGMYIEGAGGTQCALMYIEGAGGTQCALMYIEGAGGTQCALMYIEGAGGTQCALMYIEGLHIDVLTIWHEWDMWHVVTCVGHVACCNMRVTCGML